MMPTFLKDTIYSSFLLLRRGSPITSTIYITKNAADKTDCIKNSIILLKDTKLDALVLFFDRMAQTNCRFLFNCAHYSTMSQSCQVYITNYVVLPCPHLHQFFADGLI